MQNLRTFAPLGSIPVVVDEHVSRVTYAAGSFCAPSVQRMQAFVGWANDTYGESVGSVPIRELLDAWRKHSGE